MKKKKGYKIIENINKNDIFMWFFLVFALILCLFLYFNAKLIQFKINKFDEITDADLQVYILDVGQASASLIVFPNGSTMLIDTGSEQSKEEFVSDINLIMAENGLPKNLDHLVLTHSDEDHVGGAVELLQDYDVENIYRPKILSTSESERNVYENYSHVSTEIYAEVIDAVYNEPNSNCCFINDFQINIDGAIVEVFSCKEDFYNDINSYSPFIKITYQGKSFLFTGDTTAMREKEFLASETQGKVDFLIVSHHGSKYSTTKEFLQNVSPIYALISAGDSDHPSQEVLSRLKENSVWECYITKEDGMIGVGITKGKEIIKTESTFFDVPFVVTVIFVLAVLTYHVLTNNKNRNITTKAYLRGKDFCLSQKKQ